MRNKTLYLLLILVVVFALSACGSKESAQPETNLDIIPAEAADDESSSSDDTDSSGADEATAGEITGDWKFSNEYMDLIEMTQQYQDNTDAELNIQLARDTRLSIGSDQTYYIVTGDGKTYEEGTYTFEYDSSEKKNVFVLIDGSGGRETLYYYEKGSFFEENGSDPYWVRAD